MDQDLSPLYDIFDGFPEPVLFLSRGQVHYSNKMGQQLLAQEDAGCLEVLSSILLEPDSNCVCALSGGCYHITVSQYQAGQLLVLHPAPSSNILKSNATLSSQLRNYLSTLTVAFEQLERSLREDCELTKNEKLLAIQQMMLHRIFRLTLEAELSNQTLEEDYPSAPLDLALLCRQLSDEVTSLAILSGNQFRFETKLSTLPFVGNKYLLQQMLLALISNGLKSAGTGGKVGLRLSMIENRAIFNVWDNGPGIREDRIPVLFSELVPDRIPYPDEGAGLGLFSARRIVSHYGGVIMAESRAGEGVGLVVSLPIKTPTKLTLRSDGATCRTGGFSPVMVGLSDALSWEAFLSCVTE